MKNLYILPTNKPSRLVKIYNDVNRETFTLKLDVEVNDSFKEYVNIYITSDEEIKEGFALHLYTNRILEVGVITESNGNKSFREKNYHINGIEVLICDCKKIILTIDQDLIEKGVQEIPDEFLEWFVKNPSCERVRVGRFVSGKYFCTNPISSEEETKPKTTLESLQEYFKNTPKEKVLEDWNEFQHLDNEGITVKEFLENQKQTDEKGRPLTYWGGLEEMKQETLEEAAEKFYPPKTTDLICSPKLVRDSFIAGAKWQKEQNKNLYSEEDLREAFRQGELNINYSEMYGLDSELTEQQWFEQFKKK